MCVCGALSPLFCHLVPSPLLHVLFFLLFFRYASLDGHFLVAVVGKWALFVHFLPGCRRASHEGLRATLVTLLLGRVTKGDVLECLFTA